MTDEKFKTDVPVPEILRGPSASVTVDDESLSVGQGSESVSFCLTEARVLRDYLNAVLPNQGDSK